MDDLMLPRNPSPETVKAFEAELAKLPQASIPAKVFVGQGMVTRVILIPAGTGLTGKKHRKGQHNLLVSGTIAVSTDDGIREITGPEVIVSPPGTKRVAIALTEVIWSTTVICNETEIDAIEADIVDPSDVLPIVNLGDTPCLG